MNYLEVLEKVSSFGSILNPRGEECKELMGLDMEIDGTHIYSWPGIRDIKHIEEYMFKEWIWYFSGDRDHARIAESAKLWGDIKNPDGTVNSNYGYLVFYSKVPHPSLGEVTLTPFEWALQALLKDKNTRQAVVTYNTSGYNFEGNRDYICSQHQAFYIRGDRLDCYVALRSSDLIFGMTYNMPWWSIVHQQLYGYLHSMYPDLRLGTIHVKIYSAHIYKRHYELVEKMVKAKDDAQCWAVDALLPIAMGMGREYYERMLLKHIKVVGVL